MLKKSGRPWITRHPVRTPVEFMRRVVRIHSIRPYEHCAREPRSDPGLRIYSGTGELMPALVPKPVSGHDIADACPARRHVSQYV